jgi:predicted DNA-binding WGR domain protein
MKPIHLVMVEPRTRGYDDVNHNKFYDLFPKGDIVKCLYGRIRSDYVFGKTGTEAIYPIGKFYELVSSKMRKGYEDKTELIEGTVITQSKGPKPVSLNEPETVKKIIERLVEYQRKIILAVYGTNGITITSEMRRQAQILLDDLAGFETKDIYVEAFNDALLEMFKVILRSRNKVDHFLAQDESEFSKILASEQSLLDSLRRYFS